MTQIFQLILDRKVNELADLVFSHPPSSWGVSKSGRSPLELAYHSHSPISCAVLVANDPDSLREIPWTFENLIEAVIREYSDMTYCAGWFDGIEKILWAVVINEYELQSNDRLDNLSKRVVACIKRVAELGNIWVIWDDEKGNPKPVTLAKWHQIYAADA